MPRPESLHRYELMEERRTRERRAAASESAAERRNGDRRHARSLIDAPAVRRVFPIVEATDAAAPSRRHRLQRILLQVADATAVCSAIVVAATLGDRPVKTLGLVSGVLLALAISRSAGIYDRDQLVLRASTLDEVPRLLQISGVIVLSNWLLVNPQLERAGVFALWGILFVSLAAWRAVARATSRAVLPRERCLFVGDASVAEHVRAKIECGRSKGVVVGAVHLDPRSGAGAVGGVDGLREMVRRDRIERVIIAPVTTDAADTLELVRIAKLAGAQVSIFPRLFEVIGSAIEFEDVEGMTLVGVRRFGLSRGARVLKRAFDLAVGTVAVIILLPVMALIAVAVRLESPGPVLFRQARVGRDGRHFQIMKFRSMVQDADRLKEQLRSRNETDGLFKIADDPRVTRVGRILRMTSLDELPQLLNVLRGDMSLVGPRPLVIDEDDQVLGLDRARLHLTPGMTGPWQVMRSGRVPMQEMVGIDYVYVANWSLWTDLKLLLRTVSYVASRGGM